MTIKECYKKFGGDFDEILSRLRSELLIERFALKFLSDESFNKLTDALNDNRTEDAFHAAHTLKGVCGNLSFASLFRPVFQITELLCAGDCEGAKEIYGEVASSYFNVINVLNDYADSKKK